MAEYQNIFTQVQVTSPAYPGLPLPRGDWKREGKGWFFYLMGKIVFGRFHRTSLAGSDNDLIVVFHLHRSQIGGCFDQTGHISTHFFNSVRTGI